MNTDDAARVLLDRVGELAADADSSELIRLAQVVSILRGQGMGPGSFVQRIGGPGPAVDAPPPPRPGPPPRPRDEAPPPPRPGDPPQQ